MASTYLTKVAPTAGNRTKGTISMWVKRGSLGSTEYLYSEYLDSTNYGAVYFSGANGLNIVSVNGGSTEMQLSTNRLFRDTNAWYHLVFAWDTSQATASDRTKMYVNGVQETSFSTETYRSQGSNLKFGIGSPSGYNYNIYIGRKGSASDYFTGSMSHFHRVDNQQLTPSTFGSTDSTTGEWKINASPSITYTGSSSHNFFILKDGNSVTDQSGEGNNLTVGGGTLTKTEDCPSNVFATWNPLHHSTQSFSNVALKNGNTTFDNNETSSVYPQGYSTLAASSGKYYFESKVIASSNDASVIGISGAVTTETYVGQNAYTYGFRTDGSITNNNTSTSSWGSGWGVGDIVQIAVDLDNNKIYFGINGTWQNSGDPTSGSTGTGAAFTITAPSSTPHGVYHFTLGDVSSSGTFEHETNFGNGYFGTTAVSSAGTNASNIGIFEYDVPSGYTALSTKGLNL